MRNRAAGLGLLWCYRGDCGGESIKCDLDQVVRVLQTRARAAALSACALRERPLGGGDTHFVDLPDEVRLVQVAVVTDLQERRRGPTVR